MKHTVFASGDDVARATSSLDQSIASLCPKTIFYTPYIRRKRYVRETQREKENILFDFPIPSLRPKTIKNIRYTIGKILFGETQRKREIF